MDEDEPRTRSRRRYLRALGAASASSLAGCADALGGEPTPTRTSLESSCSGDETATWGPYADWFPHYDADEYTRSAVRFTTVAAPVADALPSFWLVLRNFLEYPLSIVAQLRLPVREVERVTSMRPPPESLASHVVVRHPVDSVERRTWFDRFRLGLGTGQTLDELSDHEGFSRYQISTPSYWLVAFDDEFVVAVPDAGSGVEVDPAARFERLVDTKRGGATPGPCLRPAARALVTGLPPAHFARLWVRTDGTGFPDGSTRGPAGARASALTLRVRGPEAPAPVPAASATPTAAPTTGAPSGRATATQADGSAGTDTATPFPAGATPTRHPPSAHVVDVGLRMAFPEGGVDADAARSFVADRWTIDGDPTGRIGFVDPTVERSGRVMTAAGTRSLETIVE
jgi:hypothetical protein